LLPGKDTRTGLIAPLALAAALAVAGCGRPESPDLVNGKRLFAGKGTCGSCHTLARANTKGTVGPNLDAAFATDKRDGLGQSSIEGLVLDQIAYPRNGGAMPGGLVKGQNAKDVAAYVAYAAARAGQDTGALAYVTDKASAKAGTVKFVMPNKSPIQHNIALKGPVTGAGPIVGSGGMSTFTANLKPGTYEFYCQVPGHEAAGMKGTLTVK